MDILKDLQRRELIAQIAGEDLTDHLTIGHRTLYCGFDPTADSLHVGSLIPLLTLRRFQLAGHRPLIILGGGTGLIGDPSLKSTERPLRTRQEIQALGEALHPQFTRFLDFDSTNKNGAAIINNLDWLEDSRLLTFLRDIGKHFSVKAMVNKESVRGRIERDDEGISFTEFSYMLLQAYDFLHLYRQYGCSVQIGGSDQWGNITEGINLIRRLEQGTAYGLTTPLLVRTDGTKFGKTEYGTVWLNAGITSPYRFYQFWINTPDTDVYRYLRLFTFLSGDKIDEIERSDLNAPARREGQHILAREVTRLVHGEEAMQSAQAISTALFDGSVGDLDTQQWEQLALDGVPSSQWGQPQISLADALVHTQLALTPRGVATAGQARKFICSNAITVNGTKVADPQHTLTYNNAMHGCYHLLQRGKKQYHLLIMTRR